MSGATDWLRRHRHAAYAAIGLSSLVAAFALATSVLAIDDYGHRFAGVWLRVAGLTPTATNDGLRVEMLVAMEQPNSPFRGCPEDVEVELRLIPRQRAEPGEDLAPRRIVVEVPDVVADANVSNWPAGKLRLRKDHSRGLSHSDAPGFPRVSEFEGISAGGGWRRALAETPLYFRAAWVSHRGFGSCWLNLPALLEPVHRREDKRRPLVRSGEVVVTRSVEVDLSEPPPTEGRRTWACRPESGLRYGLETCASHAVVILPWRDLHTNLAILIAGVLLGLGVELSIRALLHD
jgi:hypothetical protein